MDSWHSYPSVYTIGHRAIEELLLDSVLVEEKIDGSQFSFGTFNGTLKARSKGAQLIIDAPEKMFNKAIETIKQLSLQDSWTYRAEYLQKPKHNTLAYSRVPKDNLIVFDINTQEEKYLSYEEKAKECNRIELEVVPKLFEGKITSIDTMINFLEKDSVLGNTTIEGFVVKNYSRFGRDKKVLIGKYVSEAFKEIHGVHWKKQNPSSKDIVRELILSYKTEARWNKSIQHLREKGELEDSPRDIGKLIIEVKEDIKKECTDEIKETLFKWAIGQILRGTVSGLPEYYKKQLLESSKF